MSCKNTRDLITFQEPHFKLEDLNLDDLKDDVYFQSNRHISPEKLTAIYKQAFIYNLIYKYAKEHLPDVNEAKSKVTVVDENCESKEQATDTLIDNIKEKVIEYLFEKPEKKLEEIHLNSATDIWNSEDLNVLRKNFASIKESNFQLRSQTAVLEEENKRLKDKLATLELSSENSNKEKLTLEQENERLYIRVQDLESRYISFQSHLANTDKEKQKHLDDQTALRLRNQELETHKSKLSFALRLMEQKLETSNAENRDYFEKMLDNLKLKHEKKVRRLERELVELNNKFTDKKMDNSKTQKALEQLRSHYMLSCTNYENDDRIEDSLIN